MGGPASARLVVDRTASTACLRGFVDKCQIAIGDATGAPRARAAEVLRSLIGAIPRSLAFGELMIVGELLDVIIGRLFSWQPSTNLPRTLSDHRSADTLRAVLLARLDRIAASSAAENGTNQPGGWRRAPMHPCPNGVGRALELIDTQYKDPKLGLSTIADQVGLTRWHLARQIRAATGTSFLQHLHNRRVAEARRLLTDGDKSVKEIALLVGYAETHRLDTHFKRAEHLTPTRFRQRSRETAISRHR